MRIQFSTRLFEILSNLQADGGPFDITPRHQAALDAMPDGDWTPQSLSATQIVLTQPGGYSLTLQGSGIGPVSSAEALARAIDDGVATGAFSSLVLRQDGTELARLTLQSSRWTISSDTLSLTLSGTAPTTLQQLIALARADANAWADPQALQTLLNSYALTGLSLVNGAQEILGLSIASGGVVLRLPGLTGVIAGSFTTRLGDLLAAIARAEDAAGETGDWGEILLFDEFAAGTMTFRDGAGVPVLLVSEATNPLDEVLYYLLDQQRSIPRNQIDPYLDALLDGRMVFPATTEGNDRFLAGSAPIFALAGGGNDTITGSMGDDVITDGAGNDLIIGRDGNDRVTLQQGNDTFWGGAGHDTVQVDQGDNEVWAGPGNDLIFGGIGNDILGGGADADLIDARAGGRNQLWGGDGRDTLYAAANGDAAGGGWGDDIVYGGAGADTLMGGLGNDTVQGEGGADTLFLGMGNDLGYGGAGDDTLTGGPGFDRLWGGTGADRFEFWRNYGFNRVEDFAAGEGDVLALGRGMWTGSHGALTAAQVVSTFGSLNAAGDAVLTFAAAGTTVVLVGTTTLDGLADSLLIL